jgi:hypothetical protein
MGVFDLASPAQSEARDLNHALSDRELIGSTDWTVLFNNDREFKFRAGA